MVPPEYKIFYDFIIEVVHEAGQFVIDGFNNIKKLKLQQQQDPVLLNETEKKVEELLTRKIRNRFPDHSIITGKSNETPTEPFTWLINPIDGDENFLKGIPAIGISVALAMGKNSILAIVYNPIMNEFYSAVKSGGAYCNGERIVSNKSGDWKKSVAGLSLSFSRGSSAQKQALDSLSALSENGISCFRCFGSDALSLCYVANGNLDIYFTDALQCSKVAAGILILQEAGGITNCPFGNNTELPLKALISTGNTQLLQKTMEVLKYIL